MNFQPKIKRYDPELYNSYQAKYEALEKHHEKETGLLIAEIERLENFFVKYQQFLAFLNGHLRP